MSWDPDGASARRCQALLANVADMVTVSDRDGNTVYASPATENVSGYTPEEFMARGAFESIHPEDRGRCERALAQLVANPGLSLNLEHRVVHKSGAVRWVEGTFTSLFDDPDVGGLLATVRDITERKRTDEALRRASELDSFRVALVDALAPLSDPVEIQAEAARVLGERLGANRVMYAEVEGDDGSAFVRIAHCFADGAVPLTGRFAVTDFGLSTNGVSRPGPTVVADVAADPTRTEKEKARYAEINIGAWIGVPLIKGGRFVAALGVHQAVPRDWVAHEVSLVEETAERTWAAVERTRAEERLRESEERFRATFEQANVGIVQTTVEGRILFPNPGFCKIIGYTEREAKNLTVRDITHPDDYDADMGLAARVTAGEIPGYTIEKRYVRKDGETVWVQLTSTLVRDASGDPYYALAVVEDVDERKRTEEALQTAEANQRAILDSANQSIMLIAPDFSLRLFNPYAAFAASAVFGETMEIGESILKYVSRADHADFVRHFHQALAGEEVHVEKRLVGTDGPSWWEFFYYPIFLPDGSVGGVTLTARNVSVRKLAEETLVERDEQLALALQAADAGVSSLDLATGRGVTTPQWREVLGFAPPPAPQTLEALLGLVHPDDRERVAALHDAAASSREGLDFEFRLNHPLKGERWILSRSKHLATDGGPGRLVGIAFDITERKRAEEALRESGERQAFLLGLSDALRPLSDPVEIQKVAMRVLGERLASSRAFYYRTELQADGRVNIVDGDYHRRPDVPSLVGRYPRRAFGESLFAGLENGETLRVSDTNAVSALTPEELQAYMALDVLAFVAVPLIKDGRYVAGICVQDSSPRSWTETEVELIEAVAERTWSAVERARAEEALRRSEDQLQLALDATESGTFTWYPEEDRGEPDTKMLELFGLPEGGTLDLAVALETLIHPDDRERYAGAVARSLDPAGPGALRDDIRVIQPDGTLRWLAVTARTYFEDGRPKRMVGSAIDVTGRKRAEEERERLKMREAAMRAETSERERISRELHDRVAHSIGVVYQSLQLHKVLAEEAPERSEEKLVVAEETARRALDQTRNLAIELRRSVAEETQNGITSALWTLLETSTPDNVVVELHSSGDESRVPPDVGAQVYLVMREAVRNALRHSDCKELEARLEIQANELIGTVTDDGQGFDSEAEDGAGHRDGLGLGSMRERAEMVGGRINLNSHPGDGTTVQIRVPLEG